MDYNPEILHVIFVGGHLGVGCLYIEKALSLLNFSILKLIKVFFFTVYQPYYKNRLYSKHITSINVHINIFISNNSEAKIAF